MLKLASLSRQGNSKLVLFVKGHDEELWLLDKEAQLKVYKQGFSLSSKCLCTHRLKIIKSRKQRNA